MSSEEKLIKRAKNGDREAFGALYDTHIAPIYRFILVRVGNKADAEDLTHQTFLSAWQGLERYNFQGFPFSSWLYRIASNAVIDFYRTNKKHFDVEAVPEEMLAHNPNFQEKVDKEMTVRMVRETMKGLDHDQQTVLTLKFMNDLSNREIAEVMQKSEGAVRVIQHRALKQLRSKIDDETKFS